MSICSNFRAYAHFRIHKVGESMSIYSGEHILTSMYSEWIFGSARTQPGSPWLTLDSSDLEHMLKIIIGIHKRVFAEHMLEYMLST